MTVSPISPSYASTTPYITPAEFKAAPTALDTSDLIAGATADVQAQALVDVLARASSMVDDLTQQILAATLDLDRGRYRIDRYGMVRVPLRYKPVLEVQSVRVGAQPSTLTALTDFSNVVIGAHGTVEIPVLSSNLATNGSQGLFGGLHVGGRVLVDVGYVNGWPNTLTSGATISGASTLPVTSALGIYPGTVLKVSDGAQTESVTVAASYVAGGLSLPLVAPLGYAHAAGLSVSNLPARVKEATILLTTALIQTRGDDAIVLDSTNAPMRVVGQSSADRAAVAMAKDMLKNLGRAW